jgi:hypothetical protein
MVLYKKNKIFSMKGKSMNSSIIAHALKDVLKNFPQAQKEFIGDSGAKEIEDIIINHAIGAAAASAASGWIPGAGGTVALMAAVGFIWSMYYRINQRAGISISKNKLKSLASAVITNIAASAAALIAGVAASTVISFIPGIGSGVASIVMAALDYGVVMVSGIVYLKLLTKLFKAHGNISDISADELKRTASDVIKNEDVSSMLKDAQKEYKNARKTGGVTGDEKIDIETE